MEKSPGGFFSGLSRAPLISSFNCLSRDESLLSQVLSLEVAKSEAVLRRVKETKPVVAMVISSKKKSDAGMPKKQVNAATRSTTITGVDGSFHLTSFPKPQTSGSPTTTRRRRAWIQESQTTTDPTNRLTYLEPGQYKEISNLIDPIFITASQSQQCKTKNHFSRPFPAVVTAVGMHHSRAVAHDYDYREDPLTEEYG